MTKTIQGRWMHFVLLIGLCSGNLAMGPERADADEPPLRLGVQQSVEDSDVDPKYDFGDSAAQRNESRRLTPALVAARARTAERKREWIRDKILPQLSAEERARVEQLLPQLDNAQLDEVMSTYLRGKSAQDREAVERLAAANEQQRMVENNRRQAAGFAPVITTLPQGAQLHAGAVIGPNGNVRVNVNPFFSNIGPVRTFSPVTGYGGYGYGYGYGRRGYGYGNGGYGYGYNPGYGYGGFQPPTQRWGAPQHTFPNPFPSDSYVRQQNQVEVWHDGLRTRYGPRPQNNNGGHGRVYDGRGHDGGHAHGGGHGHDNGQGRGRGGRGRGR